MFRCQVRRGQSVDNSVLNIENIKIILHEAKEHQMKGEDLKEFIKEIEEIIVRVKNAEKERPHRMV